MKWLRWIGLLLGVLILALLIHGVGWPSIRQSLGLLGWAYGWVLLYPICWIMLNSEGWAVVVATWTRRVSFWRLTAIRLAGEAFNALLPSGYVGGEPLKAKLLAEYLPLHQTASSVLIAKAAQSVGLVFFIGMGLALGARLGHMSLGRHPIELWALGGLATGISIFIYLLSHRSFSRVAGWLSRWPGQKWISRWQPKLQALDTSLGDFYAQGRSRFLLSILWHTLGWLAGALELVVISTLIDMPLTPPQAWFMGAMAQLGSVVGLFAPAGVGLYEGGHYLAAQWLGLPPSFGISIALIRRVRELFWNSIGLAIFWRLTR